MDTLLEVECTHLEDELMRVRLANSQLVSDHPVEWGGTDTGPSPGDMVLMALTSATVLAGRKHATANNLNIAHIGARSSMTSLKQGLSDERSRDSLPHLTYVERFWRLLEVDASLSDSERESLVEAMTNNRIATTIRNGFTLDESVSFPQPSVGAGCLRGSNTLLKNRKPLPPGEVQTASVADTWRVSAAALDDRTCLVKAAGSMHVVGDAISAERSATPEELLLGGLAACTTIYLARNSLFQDIPVASVHVRIRARVPEDPGKPITQVEKVAEVSGEFTEQQRERLEDFAKLCAFGVTLSRRTPINDEVAMGAGQGSTALPMLQALERGAPPPEDPSFCSDGSCCIPVPAN